MSPSLSEVLASGNHSYNINIWYFASALAMVCAAMFTVVKGYNFCRQRWFKMVEEETPKFPLNRQSEEVEKLTFLVEELTRERDTLLAQNRELQMRLQDLEWWRKKEEVLRKSNEALARECGKLRSENEKLLLKISKPLIAKVKRARPAKKTKKAK